MATSRSRQKRDYEEEDEVMTGNVMPFPSDPVVNLITTPEWFAFVEKMMFAKVDVDVDALTAEFPEDQQRKRKGDFGKVLDYVPAKFIRERLNEVLGCKWAFFPIAEQMVKNPNPTWSKDDEEYRDSSKYIKILGVLAIPGLGVQAQYGVKKTLGFNESNDWKAAATDAFKKCAAAFGIEADYDIEDEGDDSVAEDIDLDDVEYDEDELAEALETEVTFGKYKDLTLEEILDEDPDYLEWLAGNAREKELRMAACIVLKSSQDKKKSRSKSRKSATSKKTSSKRTSAKSSVSKKSTSAKKKASNDEDEEDDEKSELIDQINEIFDESDDYDTVTIKELIKSISTSKRNPQGKKKLEELTVKELEALISVLTEDEDDEDDE